MNSNPPMTFLIVDDEELARADLCRQISCLLPSAQCIGASNINLARERLLSTPVDGVFLDLEMPGGHGMGFIPEIRLMGIPVVVTTAHERFALSAFAADATDYLMKPIEQSRLVLALGKLRKFEKDPRRGDLIVLGDQNSFWPIYLDEIVLAESQDSYVMLHLKDRKPILLSRSLKDIEGLLPENTFVRTNRSQIVQLSCLKLIRRREGGSLAADLDGHGTIVFSRRQAQMFKQRFES